MKTERRQVDQPDVTAALRAALMIATPDAEALKDAVCAYVDEMKALGASAERIIIDIKRLAEAARESRSTQRSYTADTIREMAEATHQAVTWCIERYYERRKGA